MGKGKGKAAKLIALGHSSLKPERVPLLTESNVRRHLGEYHGISTQDDQAHSVLLAIHQADHHAAGLGGRPIVRGHYHTADVQDREDEDA